MRAGTFKYVSYEVLKRIARRVLRHGRNQKVVNLLT
jgi:hypothetical protein